MTEGSRFDTIVQAVEELSPEEQELLIDLVRRRHHERRRAEIATNVAQARKEHAEGSAGRGTVHDLMAQAEE